MGSRDKPTFSQFLRDAAEHHPRYAQDVAEPSRRRGAFFAKREKKPHVLVDVPRAGLACPCPFVLRLCSRRRTPSSQLSNRVLAPVFVPRHQRKQMTEPSVLLHPVDRRQPTAVDGELLVATVGGRLTGLEGCPELAYGIEHLEPRVVVLAGWKIRQV